MELKDSKTKYNLLRAFAGESQAMNRYIMSAGVAKKEGLYIIENLFYYTANQEREHAHLYFKKLKEFAGTNLAIDAGYPIDLYDTTLPLLKAAHHNEYEEWETVYKTFGDIAKEEGFSPIANTFYKVAEIEKTHGDRFNRYATELESGTLFKKDQEIKWICTNCGHIHMGKEALKVCPVCDHPQGFFMDFFLSLFE